MTASVACLGTPEPKRMRPRGVRFRGSGTLPAPSNLLLVVVLAGLAGVPSSSCGQAPKAVVSVCSVCIAASAKPTGLGQSSGLCTPPADYSQAVASSDSAAGIAMSSDVPSTANGTGVFIPACILDGSALKNPAVFCKFPRKRRGSAISTSSGGSSKSDKSSSPASARSDSPARGNGKGHKQQHKDRTTTSEVPVVDYASAPDQQAQLQEQVLEVNATSSNSSNVSVQPGEASTSSPAAKNPFAATPKNIRQQQLLCNLVAAADSFTDPAAPPAAALGTAGLPWGSSNSASSRAPGHELPRTPAAGKSVDLTRTNSRTSLDSSYYQYAARNSMDVRSSMDIRYGKQQQMHLSQRFHHLTCTVGAGII